MAPNPRGQYGSRFGYFTGGAHWSSADGLYKSLGYRYLSETGIKRTSLRQPRGGRWGYRLDTNDAIGIAGLGKGDLVADLAEQLVDWDTWESDVIIALEPGTYLTVLGHTSFAWDTTVMLILPEKSTIGRPKDMSQRGQSMDLFTVEELGNAVYHKDVKARKWAKPLPPDNWKPAAAPTPSSH
jgi:hypothetical protein